jgi:hypothetical protein
VDHPGARPVTAGGPTGAERAGGCSRSEPVVLGRRDRSGDTLHYDLSQDSLPAPARAAALTSARPLSRRGLPQGG